MPANENVVLNHLSEGYWDCFTFRRASTHLVHLRGSRTTFREQSRIIQATFKEHSVKWTFRELLSGNSFQGTRFREHSVKWTFRELDSGNIQWSEHSGNYIQATFSEVNTQGTTFREHSVKWTFSEHSVNIQWTFREHSGNIQGTFREHSGIYLGGGV